MSRIAYVNGQYIAHQDAGVHIEDRGYQFADGVYEVWAVLGGVLQEHAAHMERLQRSLRELGIPWVHSIASINVILHEVVRQNRITNGMVYAQITRGVAPRDHLWSADLPPSLVVTAKHVCYQALSAKADTGIKVTSMADLRWKRRDIKSISLLPNVLAKQAAKDSGSYEAWLVDDEGFVTEGTSTNAWIVTQDNILCTRNISQAILSGVTRLALLEIAEQLGLKFEERKFTISEAQAAKEAFISAATTLVMPVICIDGVKIGTGKPGHITTTLRQAYLEQMLLA